MNGTIRAIELCYRYISLDFCLFMKTALNLLELRNKFNAVFINQYFIE